MTLRRWLLLALLLNLTTWFVLPWWTSPNDPPYPETCTISAPWENSTRFEVIRHGLISPCDAYWGRGNPPFPAWFAGRVELGPVGCRNAAGPFI